MALRVLSVLTRGLGDLPRVQPIVVRNMGLKKGWWKRKPPVPVAGESIDLPLYRDDIPETVLQNREKHLPDKQETPFKEQKRVCILCRHNITPDYKNVRLLSQFISGFSGIVYDRHITGLCTRRQKQVEKEVKKSQIAGLMPYVHKTAKYQNDPRLFDPAKPVRPHPYF